MCAEPQKQTAKPVIEHHHIHLANDEWGSDLMRKVAEDYLASTSNPYAVVTVHEHAGWFLEFAKLNGRTIVVGTANDMATMSEPAKCFHALIRGLEVTVTSTRR